MKKLSKPLLAIFIVLVGYYFIFEPDLSPYIDWSKSTYRELTLSEEEKRAREAEKALLAEFDRYYQSIKPKTCQQLDSDREMIECANHRIRALKAYRAEKAP